MTDWRPIETAPDGRIERALAVADGRVFFVWRGIDGEWFDIESGDWGDKITPTHWMPLPLAPTEAGTAETVKQDSVHEGGK